MCGVAAVGPAPGETLWALLPLAPPPAGPTLQTRSPKPPAPRAGRDPDPPAGLPWPPRAPPPPRPLGSAVWPHLASEGPGRISPPPWGWPTQPNGKRFGSTQHGGRGSPDWMSGTSHLPAYPFPSRVEVKGRPLAGPKWQVYPVTAPEATSPNAAVGRPGLLPGAPGRSPSCHVQLFEAPGLPGLMATSDRPLPRPHMASSPVSVLFLQGHQAGGIRAHPNPA